MRSGWAGSRLDLILPGTDRRVLVPITYKYACRLNSRLTTTATAYVDICAWTAKAHVNVGWSVKVWCERRANTSTHTRTHWWWRQSHWTATRNYINRLAHKNNPMFIEYAFYLIHLNCDVFSQLNCEIVFSNENNQVIRFIYTQKCRETSYYQRRHKVF